MIDSGKVPDWAQGKIMYQIFVDRFSRGNKDKPKEMPMRYIHKSWNDDIIVGPNEEFRGLWCTDYYGGDLKGITENLDYIKSLGVGIIYLTPIVYSQSNHRYDASDYELIDPYVGDNNDLKELCDKAHSMDIKIVLDAVFNHTGNDSKYFNQFNTFPDLGAYQSKDSKYYPFYKRVINKEGVEVFSNWWMQDTKPECNGYNRGWQDYIYGEGGIIDLWFSLGIDGLRLDVADNLTDEFIEGIRRAVKRNKEDGFILGEVWENPMRKERGFMAPGRGLDSIMNYLFMNALIRYYKYNDYGFLKHIIDEIQREYPKEVINSAMNFTSTHDISRAINIFGTYDFKYTGKWAWDPTSEDHHFEQIGRKLTKEEYEFGKKLYLSYLWNLCFLPGNLSIFYGDELGMQGLGNLCNRRAFPWNMQVDYDILNNVRNVGSIRNKEKFLEKADYETIDINSNNMSYIRRLGNEEMFVAVSRTGDKSGIYIPSDFRDLPVKYSLNDSCKDELNAYGGIALKKVR